MKHLILATRTFGMTERLGYAAHIGGRKIHVENCIRTQTLINFCTMPVGAREHEVGHGEHALPRAQPGYGPKLQPIETVISVLVKDHQEFIHGSFNNRYRISTMFSQFFPSIV